MIWPCTRANDGKLIAKKILPRPRSKKEKRNAQENMKRMHKFRDDCRDIQDED